MDRFVPAVDDQQISREKNRARDLRKTQWWKQKRAKGKCYYCKREVLPRDLTMDHVVPLIRGGRSTKNNVVPSCKECNNRKKNLLPIEWEDYLEQLKKDDVDQ
ncbi:MAG TPA: HNH endonuclease [Nitrospirae bacterium]|nr:CRISPR-associated endonuclease Cas9 [bacterium BMS3Abin10]GBE38941.1 CRISPR-associated endonuclease Cas9 [bacterium BMS3Bbin08]HDH51137.1 HNH endonuclease [Nitrospirota bacterium]HDK82489.1 HNH endonuclease [Nitrospirota bacterium]HDO25119.1 HNH endonuclease [Nitrospirota bacterium]